MERLQGFQGYVRFPGAVHIEDLSADHARGTGGGGDGRQSLEHPPGGKILYGGGHKPEGVGQQGVARKDGGGFIEGLVAGGAATAQIVIIHRGQIVVDEGVRVDHFQRGGEGHYRFGAQAEQGGGGQAQHRTEALAACEEAVIHGFLESSLHGNGVEAVLKIRLHLRAAFGEDCLDLLGIVRSAHEWVLYVVFSGGKSS